MSNKDSIILTPVKANDNQSGSLISGNTLTLFAPKANQTNAAEYGTISYNDLDAFVDAALEEYTYDKDTIDSKDADTLQSSKNYTEGYTYDKSTIDSKDTSTLNSAKTYTESYTYDKSTIDSKDATTLQSAKDYTYDKSTIDSKDADTLQSAKNYTDSLKSDIQDGTVIANKATNVVITNNDTGANNNIDFNIGTGTYTKIINNVANATTASNYASGGTIDRELKQTRALALDRQNAYTFETKQNIIDWIAGTYTRKDGRTVSDLTVGATIYNKGGKDYWVPEIPVTSIDDLEEFDSDITPSNAEDISFDDTENFNKLDADNVQEAIDDLTNLMEEKCNIYDLGQFTLASTDWTLNSTTGLYEYVFTNQNLTSSTKETIEFTPTVDSAKLINNNNIVIYNEVELRVGANGIEAVIKAQTAPSFNIVCDVKVKTIGLRLNNSTSIFANQVTYINTSSGLAAINAQNAIDELNTKINTNKTSIGTLSSLSTTVKTDLVSAVNELNTNKEIGTYLYANGTANLSSASDVIDIIMNHNLPSNVDYDRIEVSITSAGGTSGNQLCCFSEDYPSSGRDIYSIIPEYMVYDAGSYDANTRQVIPVLLNFYFDIDTDIQHARIKTCNFSGTTSTYPSFRSGTSATVKVYVRRS